MIAREEMPDAGCSMLDKFENNILFFFIRYPVTSIQYPVITDSGGRR
jgi:hypothetical protein